MNSIDVIKLAQDLIRCPSVTPEDAGAQDVLKAPLTEMGFEIFDLPFEGNGSYPVKNFFARLGTGSPHICYAGHTDVVPTGDEAAWTHPPFDAVIEDGIMYGRGTSDMKGGNAAFVAAVSQFLSTNSNFKGSISLLITGDEEADSINGTKPVLKWMKENNHLPDMAIVGEPTNSELMGDTIKIGRRGYTGGEITVIGRAGHVAYPQLALNPIPHLAKIIVGINDIVFDNGTKHFEPTTLEFSNIQGGVGANNVIPGQASAKFSVRFNNTHTPEILEKIIRTESHKLTEETDYTVELSMNKDIGESFITEPSAIIEKFSKIVEQVTGQTPELSTGGGTSDARFIKNYCSILLEFGLINKTIHQTDENVAIKDLEELTKVYATFLLQYLLAP